jgi:hypothetical protein
MLRLDGRLFSRGQRRDGNAMNPKKWAKVFVSN